MSGQLHPKLRARFLAQANFFFPDHGEWIFVRIGRKWVMKSHRSDPAGFTPGQVIRQRPGQLARRRTNHQRSTR